MAFRQRFRDNIDQVLDGTFSPTPGVTVPDVGDVPGQFVVKGTTDTDDAKAALLKDLVNPVRNALNGGVPRATRARRWEMRERIRRHSPRRSETDPRTSAR